MNIADELQKLQELRQSGAINDDEFARAKASLLDQSLAAQPVEAAPPGKGWFAAESQEALREKIKLSQQGCQRSAFDNPMVLCAKFLA